MTTYSEIYRSSNRLPLTLGIGAQKYPAVLALGLAHVDMICVKVEGLEYDIIYSGTPLNRQALYRRSTGAILFDKDLGTKSVFVIYQH